jgi:hypothetical protein
MGKAPNPTPLDKIFFSWFEDERTDSMAENMEKALQLVELHRFTNCPNYDLCLTAVAEVKWENWTCRECDAMQLLRNRTK